MFENEKKITYHDYTKVKIDKKTICNSSCKLKVHKTFSKLYFIYTIDIYYKVNTER